MSNPYSGMTLYTEVLLEEAIGSWEMGFPIDLHLYSLMASEGMDVPALEAKHLTYPTD